MTVPIEERDDSNNDRAAKYPDEDYRHDRPHRNDDPRDNHHNPRPYREEEEDRVEPEDRDHRRSDQPYQQDDNDHDRRDNRYPRVDRDGGREEPERDAHPERYGDDLARDDARKSPAVDDHPHKGRDSAAASAPDAQHAGNADAPEDAKKKAPPHSEKGDDANAQNLVNLFVKNVARHVVDDQLVELFSKYGKVDSAVVVRDPHTKECRGFGFVKMTSEEDALQAIEGLREFEFEGRRISVEKAKRKNPHSRTPGAYMGIDRRIRDRYAGMKRAREYDAGGYGGGYYGGYGGGYGGGGYGGGGYGGGYGEGHAPGGYGPGDYNGMGRRDVFRGRIDDRAGGGWDQRPPHMRAPYDERDRMRRRVDNDDPRQERDHRIREREPPVPREPTDDYV